MKKCKINIFLNACIFICILILGTIKNNINNESIKNVLQTVTLYLGILFIIYIFLACFYILYSINKDNRNALENIRKKKFKELEINSNKQIKKYIFPRQILNSKYNLVTTLFAMGKNKEAFVLLNTTKWGIYSKEVKAFKAFEHLYNSELLVQERYIIKYINIIKKIVILKF